MRTGKVRNLILALLMIVIVGSVGFAQVAHQAKAGPQVIGNPDGATDRMLIGNTSGQTQRIVYFVDPSDGVGGSLVTPAVTSTPVVSDAKCGLGLYSLHRADVYLTGTMTGTNPTLAVKWQNSIDGGNTWVDVGTWTAINATVTPVSQSQVVSDLAASTAVAFGDCFRVQLSFGGTGSVGATLEIVGFEK